MTCSYGHNEIKNTVWVGLRIRRLGIRIPPSALAAEMALNGDRSVCMALVEHLTKHPGSALSHPSQEAAMVDSPVLDTLEMLIPWERSLREGNKTQKTIRPYGDSARLFALFARENRPLCDFS